MRVAGIDLGTNTFLCLIADIDLATGACAVVRDEMRIVRLGQGVNQTGLLHPEALVRAEAAFAEFRQAITEAGCDNVLAVATSATRDAKNGQALVELGKSYGIPIEVISGQKEAELTFQGSIEPTWQGLTALIDVGGGSTEIIFGRREGILLRFSANVGSVRLTEKFVTSHPISNEAIESMRGNVRNELASGLRGALLAFNRNSFREPGVPPEKDLTLDELIQATTNVVAVAGTPTTLAAVQQGRAFSPERIHGHKIKASALQQMIVDLAAMTVEQRCGLGGMEPKRADVIVAGAICLSEAAELLRAKEMKVSIRGVRYGVAEWCARRNSKSEAN